MARQHTNRGRCLRARVSHGEERGVAQAGRQREAGGRRGCQRFHSRDVMMMIMHFIVDRVNKTGTAGTTHAHISLATTSHSMLAVDLAVHSRSVWQRCETSAGQAMPRLRSSRLPALPTTQRFERLDSDSPQARSPVTGSGTRFTSQSSPISTLLTLQNSGTCTATSPPSAHPTSSLNSLTSPSLRAIIASGASSSTSVPSSQ